VRARLGRARAGVFAAALVPLALSAIAAAKPRTWTGVIGDSMCGASHAMEGSGNEASDAACVISCVKGGERYVLVSEGKSLEIANQDFAGLAPAAGIVVRLDGDMDGEKIRVTRIEALRKPVEREK